MQLKPALTESADCVVSNAVDPVAIVARVQEKDARHRYQLSEFGMSWTAQRGLPRQLWEILDMRALLAFRRRSDFVLAVADIGCALLVAYVAYWLRFEGAHVPHQLVARYRAAAVAISVAWIVTGRVAGLYSRSALRPGESVVERAFEAAATVGVALAIANPLVFSSDLSRAWIALVAFGLLLAGVASRWVIRRSRRALVPFGIGLERYVLVGEDQAGRRLLADLTRAAGAPFDVVQVLSHDLSPQALADRAKALHVDGVILPSDTDRSYASALAVSLAGSGIDVLLAPGLGDLDMRVASIAMLHGVPLLRAAGMSPSRRAVRSRRRRRLKHGVAILGTRGVPANYGGFETFAERLALHLVQADIPVTVYCRSHYMTAASPWNGVRLVSLPTIKNKYFDTVVHTLLSAFHLVFTTRTRDVVLCNAANAPVLPLLRLARCRVIMNVDGLEWRRGKWGVAGRSWYRVGEWLSVRLASVLVTDAAEVQTYYRVRHDSDSVMIPYGADALSRALPLPDVGAELAADGYALYVSRWERENNPVMVAEAHREAGVDMPLVMLGQATYDDELDKAVRDAATRHTLLPGAIYGDAYRGLQANARCYVHATEVGGTHPALIEALGAGNLCLVLDTPENREVAGAVAWFFSDVGELAALLRKVAGIDTAELTELRERSARFAAERYSWPVVCERYVDLLRGSADFSR
jgi:glycosyltransferase involved in cell wall biosynthesis